MKRDAQFEAELLDVAAGLWIWRVAHPAWKPNQGWEPVVASTCVESGGETLALDPLAPPDGAAEVWERLDARPPPAVVVLKPDHVRDVDLFVGRYGARAFGPDRFDRHDIPETELEPIYPDTRLPGGIVALYDGWGPQRDAAVAARAACPRVRRRADGAERRAARLGDAVAPGTSVACAARAARASVRTRDRLARRAGAHPRRL